MKRLLLFLCVLIVPILACGRQITPISTATPEALASIGTATAQPANTPNPTVTTTATLPVPILAEFTVAANTLYIRSISGERIGYLSRGDVVACELAGEWCVMQDGNHIWSGCLEPNPQELGCKER